MSISYTNVIGLQIHRRWNNSFSAEFEYDFAHTLKGDHLCYIRSAGKITFAILEILLSPYSEVQHA